MVTETKVGAEAVIQPIEWLGKSAIGKVRVPKSYRHPALDARLRDERTRDEANLLIAARRAGIPVPAVADIDRANATIIMEEIEGETLKQALMDQSEAAAVFHLEKLGRYVSKMHKAGITHGDLTTSNVILAKGTEQEMVLIDFGLGRITQEAEEKAVDLHLIEEALEATDPRAEVLVAAFMAAYQDEGMDAAVFRRLGEVRDRGRYRGAG